MPGLHLQGNAFSGLPEETVWGGERQSLSKNVV
jgi:hypothetical protein